MVVDLLCKNTTQNTFIWNRDQQTLELKLLLQNKNNKLEFTRQLFYLLTLILMQEYKAFSPSSHKGRKIASFP